MSMKLMVRVLEEIEVTRPQQLVLVAMAENARDDGSKCFPSIDLIAWKAGYKPRAVVDIIRGLRKWGVLEIVEPSTAQRPTEYQIHLDRAPKKPSFDEWQQANGRHIERAKSDDDLSGENAPVQNGEGCNFTSQGVHSHVRGVQFHVTNPSLSGENAPEPVNEPVNRSGQEPAKRVRADRHEEFEAFWRAYPSGHGNKQAAWAAWQAIDPDEELVELIGIGLATWKASDRWQRGYVKAAQTWLRERWFDDDPPPPADEDTYRGRDRPWLDTPEHDGEFDFFGERKRA